jgi:hypothetical protein
MESILRVRTKDGIIDIPALQGADGLSAYQIWLNAGNTGTEADFLESLKGAGGSARATDTYTLELEVFVPEKPNDKSLGIYVDPYNAQAVAEFPMGVEIAKIEGTFDGVTWFDFKRMYETESSSPYFFANTHTFNDESMGMLCIVSIVFTTSLANWATRIVDDYELQSVRLTYYKD